MLFNTLHALYIYTHKVYTCEVLVSYTNKVCCMMNLQLPHEQSVIIDKSISFYSYSMTKNTSCS